MKAFPKQSLNNVTMGYPQDGMDLRDYFAAKALQGILAHGVMGMELPPKNCCERSYAYADWMMKVRNDVN